MNIVKIESYHYPDVAAIYLQGIATGHATFQTNAPTWEEWDKSHLPHSRIAGFINDEMVGWAALSAVSNRCVYAGVGEVSIYMADDFRGKRISKILFSQLIKESEENGLWTLQSGIFPENMASIRLHEAFGFRQIGYREKIGQMNGVWRDTIIMERRSKTVGI
jgi:L-amino acid N-acyltransferase YncA